MAWQHGMTSSEVRLQYLICPVCAHRNLTTRSLEKEVDCERCGHRVYRPRPRSAHLTLVFSLTALIFYIPANVFPFMTIELYGNRNSSTIWGGVQQLFSSGEAAIALIVLLASIIIPFFKLIILFYISLFADIKHHPHFKTKLYEIVEAIGRWSMLDIFLLAVLIAIMKLGPWTTVRPEVGSLMFAFVVIFTMLASAAFDPQLLWRDKNEELAR